MATIPFKNVIFMMQNRLSLSTSRTQLSVSVSASYSDSYPSFDAFTIDYLTIKCGFTLKSAITTARKIHVDEDNVERSDAVVSLLKSHGFDDAQICKIIQRSPILLNHYRVEENLEPKLEYLVENGFTGPHLHELIVRCPRILSTSLSDRIMPSLEFLRLFLGTEERLKLAVKRHSWLLAANMKATVQPNIYFLVKEGVPLDAIKNLLVSEPNRMLSNVDRLAAALKMVNDLFKLRPTDPKFLLVVTRMASIGVPLWEKKLQVFKSLGFSQQQALSVFKLIPQCMSLSEEKLSSKLGFYLNTVKLARGDIVSYPSLLTYAIETRIRPRHNVLKLLLSKKLLKEDAKIAGVFLTTEEVFLRKYVLEHLQEVPSLLEMYNNNDIEVKKIDML